MDDIQELYSLFPEVKDHIFVEKKIGQGTFSYVYLGHFLKKKDEKIALKYIIPTSSPSRTKQEIECLLNIGGQENVIGVLSVLRNKSHVLILMPYIEHEPFHETFVFWNINEVKEYIKNLLIALNRVHQCGTIHRDVKPSNFLYDRKRKQYALVDFGLAQHYEKCSSENIFVYEKLNKKTHSSESVSSLSTSSSRKNLIAISSSKKSSASSHLVLTNTQKHQSISSTVASADANSLPHDRRSHHIATSQMTTSQSFDRNLSSAAVGRSLSDARSVTASRVSSASTQSRVLNSVVNVGVQGSKPKTATTPNLQKFHSFHKTTSFMSEAKCNCFNTQFVCDICTTRNTKWAPRAGTAGFRAPEILFRSSYQTPSIDIWSAGIIFLSLLSGRYPFFKATDDTVAIMQLITLFGADCIRKGANKYGECLICSYEGRPTDLKETCIELRKNMIKGLCEQKSKKGLSEKDIASVQIEFPPSAYDLLKKLLEIDWEKRLSAEDALNHSFFMED